jgi:hypothetical protein
MIDILTMSAELLTESGFTTSHIQVSKREAIAFEDPTVLGFLFDYSTPQALLDSWVSDTNRTIADHQMALRRAGQKAWNTYAVMLAAEPADYQGLVALAGIEEDLTGTRKIVRAGIQSMADLRVALLTLLPIQSAPKLEAVDLVAEIRIRTSGMSARAIDAFLSNAEESVVLQVLEQEP